MSHVPEIMTPPDLSYPPNELNLDRLILTYEMSRMRTRLAEESQSTKPQISNEMSHLPSQEQPASSG